MNFQSSRIKLALIAVLSIGALLIVALIGFSGIREGENDIEDVAFKRMPAVQGLLMVSKAQTAVKN